MPMSTLHTIHTIAKFERKALLRSWFFRIFAILFIVAIGIFNVAMFIESSGAPWMYRALPASLPYANLIILNLGQAIVAVFLASEFLKQDRKNDSVEVIYARSMTNFHYILGKTLGILTVFIVLNFIILLIGMGFSFLSSDSAKGISEFFLYPILISIPTLVFILGLSFFIMTLIRNQAITFILILGYIALTVFYLSEKFYHLFDFIAYNVPLLSSTFGGLPNLFELILHRGIYLLVGIGLILITAFKLQRLPQSTRFNFLPLILALLFLLGAFFMGYQYIGLKKEVLNEKKQMVQVNNRYAFRPRVSVDNCSIELEHLGKRINAKATLNIYNRNEQKIDTLIFSLNPALQISSIEINGKSTAFTRELHLIIISDIESVLPSTSRQMVFSYSGTINENTHFLDINPDEYSDYLNFELFKARKRFAYVTPSFVCLTSESLWYPTSGVTYATARPAFYQSDFSNFSLKVKTSKELTAVSQGRQVKTEKGIFEFTNDYPLPKISLLIADYVKHELTVDSIEFSLYTKTGNGYYLKEFEGFADTLPAIIRELRTEYETLLELPYGFNRFSLAEIPINYALDKHIWSAVSDAVQPEIIFYPERGVLMEETDFLFQKSNFEKRMKKNNEELTPIELQTRMFKQVIRKNIMTPSNGWYEFGNIVDKYTYSLTPQFYSYITQIKSHKFPIFNIAMETYISERNQNYAPRAQWFFGGISHSDKIYLELKEASINDIISKGNRKLDKEVNVYKPLTLNDVIMAKGKQLFSLLIARFGEKPFNNFISQFIESNAHKTFSLNDLDKGIQTRFGSSITGELNSWYLSTTLPGFLVNDLKTYKVLDGEYTKYQVKFIIVNPEPVDGVVEVIVDLDNKSSTRSFTEEKPREPDYFQRILIPAQSAKEVGIIFNREPKKLRVLTGISENLPNTLTYELTDFEEVKRVTVLDGVKSAPFIDNISKSNEFIVDNEDEGFSFYHQTQESYLKSIIKNKESSRYKYTGIHFWNPSREWEPVLQSGFYGKYIQSAYYTASGDGSRYAQWKANLPQSGYYDVYCHNEKINIDWNRNESKSSYNYRIYHDDGIEDITLSDEELEKGWNYMGTFYISPENATVELTNKSNGSMVYADAIKWVKK
ncbi:MAG: hypothetical protein RBR40_07645 [Tenuifilaceae bacterium]|nr:hypothetical protein [Tenuifilaceae bacterium]